jgi:hypothetical protein
MARGSFLGLPIVAIFSMTAAPAVAQAPPAAPAPTASGAVYLISFFEVDPAAAAKILPLLRGYAIESLKPDGNSGALLVISALLRLTG